MSAGWGGGYGCNRPDCGHCSGAAAEPEVQPLTPYTVERLLAQGHVFGEDDPLLPEEYRQRRAA